MKRSAAAERQRSMVCPNRMHSQTPWPSVGSAVAAARHRRKEERVEDRKLRIAAVGDELLAGLGDPADTDLAGTGSAELWITADEDHLRTLVDRTDIKARFIARYSGWGPSQLAPEIQAGGWLVLPSR